MSKIVYIPVRHHSYGFHRIYRHAYLRKQSVRNLGQTMENGIKEGGVDSFQYLLDSVNIQNGAIFSIMS